MEFLGGYLFGVVLGSVYSTIGLTLGQAISFFMGKWLQKSLVKKIVPEGTLEWFHSLMKRQGRWGFSYLSHSRPAQGLHGPGPGDDQNAFPAFSDTRHGGASPQHRHTVP
jgi:hypothetical protein